MDKELLSFIDSVYHEQYSLINNNCIHKSLKIRRKAKELGIQADLVWCTSVVRMKVLHDHFILSPHMYTIIKGQIIDVSLDPGHEARYCLNSEKKLILSINLSRIGRRIQRLTGFRISQRKLDQNGY